MSLYDQLVQILAEHPRSGRYWVAFSGGLDSTVLLHLMKRYQSQHAGVSVTAVHVNHGLHGDAGEWARHCEQVCKSWQLDYQSITVQVHMASGQSLEEQARESRYQGLAKLVEENDCVLTAHHADDQVETVLMRLFRGAGVSGLTGMPQTRRLGSGFLLRPLLAVTREDLQTYGATHGLSEVLQDPSNTDSRFDRNFLRHQILPAVRERWGTKGIHRAREHLETASDLLRELAEGDIAEVSHGAQLRVSKLLELPPARQANALRYWIVSRGFLTPSTARLNSVLKDMLQAKPDAMPHIVWNDVELRRYRDLLHLQKKTSFQLQAKLWQTSDRDLDLGEDQGHMTWRKDEELGVDTAKLSWPLSVKYRAGGECIKAYPGAHRRELRKLFQEQGVFPWVRDRIPLVYSGEDLICVGGLFYHSDYVRPGLTTGLPVWVGHPRLTV